MDTPASVREAAALERADHRLRRRRETLRPLAFVFAAAVVIDALSGHPTPGRHGEGAGVVVAVVVFTASIAVAVSASFTSRSVRVQAAVIAAMGAAGVALVALQPHGATELAGGAAVWIAVARLPLPLGAVLGAAVAIGLGLAVALSGGSAATIVAVTLLCVLLGLVAYFAKLAHANQERTELLLTQLEDAREEQLRAAAVEERTRIASELHDVLAHSLSGAAIQLQGARRLVSSAGAAPEVRAAIDRAADLVRDGLSSARQAVGTLRGEELPGIAQLDSLVARFRNDTSTDVALTVEGSPRSLPAEASLALYRGAQEALTNIARYAPGAAATVVLRYGGEGTTLTVEDRLAGPKLGSGLAGVGGGNGLAGLRERLERAGGSVEAGPTPTGWRVVLDIPA